MVTAREVAMHTLAACERQGAWSDGYLKRMLKEHGLDSRDAGLATRLCFGVLQNRLYIDWHLARFSRIALEKLDLYVLCNLRVAAYQIMFLDKIPPSAAVNEAVTLTKKHCRNPKASGMVNGILRSMLREEDRPLPCGKTSAETLSLRYSHPLWLVNEFISILGERGTEELLAASNSQPQTAAQVNTCRGSVEDIIDSLRADGVSAKLIEGTETSLILSETGNIENLTSFQKGMFYIQDRAAHLAVAAAGPVPGQRILDCCAAPGGKSFAAAISMRNVGEVVSCDIHPHKIALLEAGRDRLGLDIIKPQLQSATEHRTDWENAFDVVITDVPCSGLGIIRKKPDIRFKDPEPLKNLPSIQTAILNNCASYVKPGGILIYSTCTVLPRENEEVVQTFLDNNSEFHGESLGLDVPGGHRPTLTFWPHIHNTDGFFVAKFRKEV